MQLRHRDERRRRCGAGVDHEQVGGEGEDRGGKGQSEVELDTTLDELTQLANENRDLHGECDYTLKNFDVKQESRDNEIEALKQSVAILSGASLR